MSKFQNSLIALGGLATLALVAPLLMPLVGLGSNGSGSLAAANQPQSVNVVNTPSVNVTNFPAVEAVTINPAGNTVKVDSSSPVQVRDVDTPGQVPFAASCTIDNNNGFPCLLTVVPGGKRLVIEMFQLQLANSAPELIVHANNSSVTYRFFEPSQLVRIYADAGTSIEAQGGPNGTVALISGYLADAF